MDALTGMQLGPYRVTEPLGRGGMAAVYKAYQPGMDRYVALKVLPRELAADPKFVARFHQEVKVVARLQHPHILPVFDFGEAQGFTYIVMPYIQSGTVAGLLTGAPLPVPQAIEIATQVGDALDYAHSQGLVHRDVKPSNILIDARGNCLLTDFGIAKIVEGTSTLTQTGTIMGTPAYMAPEQGMGGVVDARSDIYSLGVVLYELATGRVPFDAETPIAVIFKHLQHPLPPPRSINPALPEPIERVILKAMAKAPEDRYQTAGEMVRALEAAGAASAARPVGRPVPLPIPPLERRTQPPIPEPPTTTEPLPAPPEPRPTPEPHPRPLWWMLSVGALALLGVLVCVGLAVAGGGAWLNQSSRLTATARVAGPVGQAATATAGVEPSATIALPSQTPPPPVPTSTPSLTPPPTATLPPFESVALGAAANADLATDFVEPPTGALELGGVPFDLDGRAFKTQAEPAPFDTLPTLAGFDVQATQVDSVYVLLTAGDGFVQYATQPIGEIRLWFSSGAIQEVQLVLGDNVREWHAGPTVVSRAPNTQEVWSGPVAGHPEVTGWIDLLTIDVPDDMCGDTLARIEVEDLSAETVGQLDPALTVSGISLAHCRR